MADQQDRVGQVLALVGHDLAFFTLIADLTDLRPRCRLQVCGEALVARYLDLPFAAVSFYGQGGDLRAALIGLIAPDETAYALIGQAQLALLQAVAQLRSVTSEWQMAFTGRAAMLDAGGAVPLADQDWPDMLALAGRGGVYALEEHALRHGPYWGVWRDGRLVSMAGTRLQVGHVAEIGNVVTDPDYRRQGLALQTVSAVTGDLLSRELTVILHVFQSNQAAQMCYRRLGFEPTRAMYLTEFGL